MTRSFGALSGKRIKDQKARSRVHIASAFHTVDWRKHSAELNHIFQGHNVWAQTDSVDGLDGLELIRRLEQTFSNRYTEPTCLDPQTIQSTPFCRGSQQEFYENNVCSFAGSWNTDKAEWHTQ
jgi:hypothetical protein